ncbi:competence type IV pilus minor pilin ComGF [Staphylococcus succinus]|uniref:competence type IV pilus minor pilin ComGF n=1 Tax=Staphylococcus succinus TaxID=61015 RepID=UPI003F5C6531
MITFIILSAIPSLIKTTTLLKPQNLYHINTEIEFFARDLTNDLIAIRNGTTHTKANGKYLLFSNGEKEISYELKNNKIIKTIQGRGNITMLNNVKAINFKILKFNTIKIMLKIFEEGYVIEKEIYL